MKTLAFCNLIPRKWGAFEQALIYEGMVYRQKGDTLILGLAGEPMAAVAEALRKEGVRWHVLTGWEGENGRPNSWRFFGAALRLLSLEKPDVATVCFGNEIPSLLVSLLAPLVGVHCVKWVWIQQQQIRDPVGITRWISRMRLLNLRFNHFVATYEGGCKSLIRRGIPANKITVIDNAVSDYRAIKPKGWLSRELGLPPETDFIVTTSSLIERKRIDFILRAFAQVQNSLDESPHDSRAHLLVVGDGAEREKLERLAVDLKIAGQVHFLGLRNDVREILAESAIYVHAATAEAGAYAILEAMSAGLPVVVTEAGAARYQIVHGETGYVLARDDFDGFCGCIKRLMREPDGRVKLGQAGRQRWETRYRLEHNVGLYHTLYLRVAYLRGAAPRK